MYYTHGKANVLKNISLYQKEYRQKSFCMKNAKMNKNPGKEEMKSLCL